MLPNQFELFIDPIKESIRKQNECCYYCQYATYKKRAEKGQPIGCGKYKFPKKQFTIDKSYIFECDHRRTE